MSPRLRLVVFILACLCVLPAFWHVALHMPRFGAHPLPYSEAINAIGTRERHVTNMVSAVNFDYRGFDTLGEEFMLLCAVTGVTVLLRGPRGKDAGDRPGKVKGRPILPGSEAIMLICRMFGALTLTFGIDVALHGMTTPGGGFQGGVIIASSLLLIFMGEGYRGWRKLMHSEIMDAFEGGGATLYALCGFASMVTGAPFLYNILPLGTPRDLFSGGLMLVENGGVAFAVAGGFAVVFLEFLEETRTPEDRNLPVTQVAMSPVLALLPWIVATWLLAVGLYGIITSRNYIHLIGCLSVVQAATYVLLLSVGYRHDAGPPIFYTHPPGTPAVDPVLQALVLTDIVIGATVTALLLALVLQLHKRRGTIDAEKLRPMNNQ